MGGAGETAAPLHGSKAGSYKRAVSGRLGGGAQSGKYPTLGFRSGHDLLCGFEPTWGSVLTAQSLLGILSLPFSLTLPHLCTHTFAFCLSNKYT